MLTALQNSCIYSCSSKRLKKYFNFPENYQVEINLAQQLLCALSFLSIPYFKVCFLYLIKTFKKCLKDPRTFPCLLEEKKEDKIVNITSGTLKIKKYIRFEKTLRLPLKS